MLRSHRPLSLSRSVLCLLALLATLQPCVTFATVNEALYTKPQPAADIALVHDGVLQGQVVNNAGKGEAGAAVQLTNGKQHWQTRTDEQGWFRLPSLRGGTYHFQVAGQSQLVRAWAPGTAPPNASQGILVTPPSDVFRGQQSVSPTTNRFFRFAKHQLSKPLVLTGITLTAVAIPVAIHNSDDDPPATP